MVVTDNVQMKNETNEDITMRGSTITSKAESGAVESFYGMLSVRATEISEGNESDRTPVIIVAVVDKSGSMSVGGKLEALKKTLLYVIQVMTPADSLCIIEYDSNVTKSFPLTLMTPEAKVQANNIVHNMRTGSSTNLSGGLREGLRTLIHSDNETVINSILLMTDGLANEGIRDTKGILAMMKQEPIACENYSINTFGFGSDHDTSMLKEIADAGNGMYYYVEDDSSIAENFGDCLAGLFSVVGQGAEIVIKSLDEYKIQKIWTFKDSQEIEPNKEYRIQVGDLQAGEERDIPIQFSLPEETPGNVKPIATAALSYYNVKAEVMMNVECSIILRRVSSEKLEEEPMNLEIDKHCNRCLGGKVLLDASELAGKGSIDAAKSLLRSTIEKIEKSPSASDPFCKTLVFEMNNALSGFQNRTSFRGRGQFQARGRGCSYVSQRAAPAPSSAGMFSTSSRDQMKEKFSKISIPEISSRSSPAPAPVRSRGVRGRGRGSCGRGSGRGSGF